MKKQFLSSIPEVMESNQVLRSGATKVLKSLEPYLYILAVFFGMLILYAMARIISLQRRVRDLEARPPVDDITLRGAVRLQLNDLVSDLEQSIRAKQSVPDYNGQKQFVSDYNGLHATLTQSSQSDTRGAKVVDYGQNQKRASLSASSDSANESPSANSNLVKVDEELNQVLEIANSVKASLPDVRLFANAMSQQKKQQQQQQHTLTTTTTEPLKEEVKNSEIEILNLPADSKHIEKEEVAEEEEKEKVRWTTPGLKRDKKKTQPPPTFKAGSKRRGGKLENDSEANTNLNTEAGEGAH